MKIYILFDISYDYHRFEEFIGAFETEEKAMETAKESHPELKVYKYTFNRQDDFCRKLRSDEIHHLHLIETDLI